MLFVWLLPCMTSQHPTGLPLQQFHLDDVRESGRLTAKSYKCPQPRSQLEYRGYRNHRSYEPTSGIRAIRHNLAEL